MSLPTTSLRSQPVVLHMSSLFLRTLREDRTGAWSDINTGGTTR